MKKILMACLLFLVGCSNTTLSNQKLLVGGSTSVQPLMEKLAEAFNDKADVEVQGGGSTVGFTQTVNETFDLGILSRDLKESERGKVKETVIAHDGIAIVVNQENPVKNLTLEQIKGIYTGKIKSWKKFGVEEKEIIVISRESGSGTRGAFEEIIGFKESELVGNSDIQNSTGAIIENIKANKYTIGYISFGSLNDKVKAIKVNDVEVSEDNIKNKSYKIARNFIVVNKNDKAKAFIDFILSDAGQKIVAENKYIPVK